MAALPNAGIPTRDVDRYDAMMHVMTRVSYAGYRSYVINHNLGQELVHAFAEAPGGTAGDAFRRWRRFLALLQSPRLRSELR